MTIVDILLRHEKGQLFELFDDNPCPRWQLKVGLSLSSDLSALGDPERGTLGAMHSVVCKSSERDCVREGSMTVEMIEVDRKQKKLSLK